jgi:hypothetical protein
MTLNINYRTTNPREVDQLLATQLDAVAGNATIISAVPGEDIYDKMVAALAEAKLKGGGHIILPKIGGVGYTTRDWIRVDFDYCVIELNDNIKLTKNTVRQTAATNPNNGSPNTPNLFDGVFVFRGTTTSYLKGCVLFSRNKSKVDGNGIAIDAQGSYVHDAFANGNYSAVQFTMCDRPLIHNIISENSLSFGIQMSYSPGGIISECEGNAPKHENGIQVTANAEHIRTFSDEDQNTWGNYRILNCSARNCPNHGIGSFGAVGTFILNPKVTHCGNNTGTSQAGPAGGINVEHDMVNLSRDYRTTIVMPQVTRSYGFAIRTNCVGTQVIGGFAKNTKKPSAYVETNPTIWGSAVFVQGAATLELTGFDIDGSDRVGIRANEAGGLFPTVVVNGGKIRGCKERAIYAIGFAKFIISSETDISNNGDSTNTDTQQLFTCEFNNQPSNTDAGTLKIQGNYQNNQGCVALVTRVGTVTIDNVTGGENNANTNAVAYHSFYLQNIFTSLSIGSINLTGSNLKQTRVVRMEGTFGPLFLSPDTVNGFQLGASLMKIDYTGATLSASNYSTVIYNTLGGLGALTVPAASGGIPGTLTFTHTIRGLNLGDIVQAAINRDIGGCYLEAIATSTGTTADNVTVRLRNFTASPVNITSGGTINFRATRVLGN